MTMNDRTERIAMVKAMEFIARQINDEEEFDGWLMNGVADGDIPYGDLSVTDEGAASNYTDDADTFAELMATFLHFMRRAEKSGGLYCGGVVSAPDNRPKAFATVEWQNEDIKNALELADIPATRENVRKLKGAVIVRSRIEERMIEAGWDAIYAERDQLIRENMFDMNTEKGE